MPPPRRSRPRARLRSGLAIALILVIAVIVFFVTRSAAPTTGYDASYPQCSGSYPSNALFGIVGVNGGVANTANPCLSAEVQWARATPGQKHPAQPSVSLYIDTGNPGAHHVGDWPTGGSAPGYGACNGKLTNACSYIYGRQRAAYSYRLAASASPPEARSAPWWLDVELASSWAGTYQLNVASLQGFIAGLRSAGASGPIGIYSTAAQWKDITGLTTRTTAAAFKRQLPDWVAGTEATLAQARQNCTTGGFTGVAPSLAQYRLGGLDADLRCTVTR